ncbi:unnamed protein product [Rhizoctonia solani]|uniref:ZZ-type domain-containing protein n=1 Tax=Rhizoctonia solani TaxID=456999 RepID=A0A8H3A537_9AGAM|nr:unnamed protein product [Rhizoctonia solani]
MAFYRSPVLASAFPIASVSDKPPTGVDLYARFAFAGGVCCAVTHGALTPVDVVKTRIQLEPEVYNKGMVGGFRQVIANEGAGALLTGLGPTVLGYALQGAFKFGGYEFWKKTFIDAIGVDAARENRQAIYLASSGIAEFFADIVLCPLEATRIRLVSQPTFANGLLGGFARIAKEEGVRGFYSGFGPILFKQVPYTMAKFAVYEVAFEKAVQATGKPKSELSPSTQSALNLGSGLVAGFAAAIISQPADTLLSKINKTKGLPGESISSRLIKMARDLGPAGLFTGMGARLVMIGTLTAGQFVIYGDIKRVLGATGGIEIAKSARHAARSPRMLTVVYQDGTSGDAHYASIPPSSIYEEVLEDARQCFEEYLPNNPKLELKHEIGEGRWASIHPRLFGGLVQNSRIKELKLSVRQTTRSGSGSGANNAAEEPPSYSAATSPTTRMTQTQVLDNPAIPITDPLHAAYCDRCSQAIYGIRYKCTICNDFDYCGVCIGLGPLEHGHRFDAIINTNVRLYRPRDAWRAMGEGQTPGVAQPTGDTWHECRCDICGVSPIRGTRFKCAECPDWDACQSCLERSSELHPDHMFIRVTGDGVLVPRNTTPLRLLQERDVKRCGRCSSKIIGPTYFQV